MFKFAFKNMLVKKSKILLVVFSIVLSASVGILAYNISAQVKDGLVDNTAYYDTIVGPSGSDTDLAMTTMFFTGSVTETISYEYYEQIKNDMRVSVAVPFAMGDSYNGSKIIGTSSELLAGRDIDKGEMFDEKFEAVVGYEVAKYNGLKIGDELTTSHGISGTGHDHASTPLKVVGILEKTNSAYDSVVFTQVETLWAIHDHGDSSSSSDDSHEIAGDIGSSGHATEEEGEHLEDHSHDSAQESEPAEGHSHGSVQENEHNNDHADDTHDEHDEHGEICAILIKCKSAGQVSAVQESFKGNSELIVITPHAVMREVLSNLDTSVYIVYALCAIILIMNICIISVITLLNMYDSKKEIALMRLIGIGMNKINLLYIIQNGIIGFISTVLAYGVSRLCLVAVKSYVSSMGIVLTVFNAEVLPIELAIMGLVFLISVLPTVICTINMSKKDGVSE